MALDDLTTAEREVVRECLQASVEGPFFPDREFVTLFGVEREQVKEILKAWPNVIEEDEDVSLVLNNAMNSLLGYPHECKDIWSEYISVLPGEVARVFQKWRDKERKMGNQSTKSGRPLGGEELAGVAYHLFSEGEAVVDTNPNEAIVWFVQCLLILKQVPDNGEFVVAALYFAGRALAQLSRNEASACVLQAAAYVGQALEGETATDNLYAKASLLSAIGAQALARHWFQEAGKRYEALGLSDKAANCQQEAERTALGRVGQTMEASTDPVEISFLLEGRVRDRMTVNREGEISWEEFPLDRPVPVGRGVPWQIDCAQL